MSSSSLNSNVLALRIQRNLASATESVGSSFERLATGQRINRAADDAAGLAIADSLRVDSRLLTTAVRNVNDGISALNIINGALDSQSSILQRMSELAEQAANGTFSENQRQSLQNEYYSLTQEFGRIGSTTSFNGLNLLLGGRGGNLRELFLQAGIRGDANAAIKVTTGDTGYRSGIIDRNGMRANTNPVTGVGTFEEISSAANDKVMQIRIRDSQGVEHDALMSFYDNGSNAAIFYDIYVRAEEASGTTASDAGKWKKLSIGALPRINFRHSDGAVTSVVGSFTNLSNGATITFDSSTFDSLGLKISDSSGNRSPNFGESTAIDISGVETAARGRKALDIVMARLNSLSLLRGGIGASQSRLNVALDLNQSAKEASSAAESRIRDVDVATETASLVLQQIRQQSATSILKNANSQPQILLSLLSDAAGRS